MPNRTLCAVLEEIRKVHETRNYSYLLSLVEEAQTMGNRMEAGLWDKNDYERVRKEVKELKKKRDRLKKKVAKLEEKSSSGGGIQDKAERVWESND